MTSIYRITEFALKAKPQRRYIPKARIQYNIWWFVTSQPFEYAIFGLIMANTITLAIKVSKRSFVSGPWRSILASLLRWRIVLSS